MEGGLDLRDPETLSTILVEKIWRRWLQNKNDLWEKIWKIKYFPDVDNHNLIRLEGNTSDYTIWNIAWKNKSIIQQHCFWEVLKGLE